jgi:hypothetical protein
MQDIVNQKKKFIVTVYGTEEQFKEPFKTKFILEPQKTLKDLYPVLTVKVKVSFYLLSFLDFDSRQSAEDIINLDSIRKIEHR